MIDAIAAFLYREARLIDDMQLDEWLTLFAPDGIYWVPIDGTKAPETNASLIFDTTVSREERVYHLLDIPFASQSPRSRTIHVVSNVEILENDGAIAVVRSNQVVYEMRTGDFRQAGLGDVRANVASVEHRLHVATPAITIARKKVLLIDRDAQLRNLTFLL